MNASDPAAETVRVRIARIKPGRALLSGINMFRGSVSTADDETIVVLKRCSTG